MEDLEPEVPVLPTFIATMGGTSCWACEASFDFCRALLGFGVRLYVTWHADRTGTKTGTENVVHHMLKLWNIRGNKIKTTNPSKG